MMQTQQVAYARLAPVLGALSLAVSCSPATEVAAAGPTAGDETLTIIESMVSAHGGMEAWSAAPAVSFECSFTPAGASASIVSRETIEQGSRRAYIDYPGTEMSLAWDGENAWSENWSGPYPPRFMALLNYYFVNLPWLTMDPGVILDDPETATLWDDPTEYVTIEMNFDPGVGDTPDDYYVLYIDPTTNQLKAVRYVVTYAAMVPEGAKSTPEHILVYDEFTTVEGLTVPTRCSIYEADGTSFATSEIGDWSFSRPFDAARMTMPAGAEIDTSEH